MSQTYHLLVGYLPCGTGEPTATLGQVNLDGHGPMDLVDVPQSPTAMQVLLAALQTDTLSEPTITWHEDPGDLSGPTTVFTGEQTNTTVRLGDGLLMKIFRRLHEGRNRELSILAGLSTSQVVPRLYGTVGTHRHDLAMICQRVPDALDGWEYARQQITSGHLIGEDMNELGSALARIHEELAQVGGITLTDSFTLEETMVQHLDLACREIPELGAYRDKLETHLQLVREKLEVQMIHGDFHLGQCLKSPQGWVIIDFEGEPLKTPEEREAPDSRWRDVAGLLRSIDYLDGSAPGARPGWAEDARAGFLGGYSAGKAPGLLRAYELDKAIYEWVYEVRNRPDWVDIPRKWVLHQLGSVN